MANFLSGRRPVLKLLSALFVGFPVAAFAQGDYPSKTITLVNPFPAGGPSDIIARSLAARITHALKQTVVVDNRSGAGGNIAADLVAKAPPDGYTLLVGIDTTFTVNPHIYARGYTTVSDMQPLMIVGTSGLLIGVNPQLGVSTLGSFISLARKEPLNFASGGNGSPGHLSLAQIVDATGAKITHIPYKGNAPAVLGIVSGEVSGGTLATPGMLPQVQAGKIVPLAVTSRQRSPLLPQVPTVEEAGFGKLGYEVSYVVMAPKGLAAPIAATLEKTLSAAMQEEGLVHQFRQLDIVPETITGLEAKARLEAQARAYAPLVKSAGVTVN